MGSGRARVGLGGEAEVFPHGSRVVKLLGGARAGGRRRPSQTAHASAGAQLDSLSLAKRNSVGFFFFCCFFVFFSFLFVFGFFVF